MDPTPVFRNCSNDDEVCNLNMQVDKLQSFFVKPVCFQFKLKSSLFIYIFIFLLIVDVLIIKGLWFNPIEKKLQFSEN